MNKTTSVLHHEEPAPFIGIRCLDKKQAKQFLHSVADVINENLDDSCQASTIQNEQRTDCLFQYANGARVRILIELPSPNRQEVAV